ncbi:CRISPR-associated endonuclease Cas2 [Lujinxingia vulgaris]|uniref:CRISPR-associated endoribonuclease Cas2 n=1 Tax=Lujinxingia vulgaris TaxID=2600176 RepID=A0A5C6X5B6_9DELT|nr:CRISPR-associated endonuclease Cas2 [Lujinxingia vulgaris]TXD34811.1 CRISPR-associated endonuclease Cas2 [Lujinxingia vulgaris]
MTSTKVRLFIITYDITDDKRLRKVFEYLKQWGQHVQYSVFACALGPTSLATVKTELDALIHHDDDQVLFFDLGAEASRAQRAIDYLGVPFGPKQRKAIVL